MNYTLRGERAHPSQPNESTQAREVPACIRHACTNTVFLSYGADDSSMIAGLADSNLPSLAYQQFGRPATLIPGLSFWKGSFDGSAMLAPGASTTKTRLAIDSKSARK